MGNFLILASGSVIRAELLRNAGLEIDIKPARLDEEAIRETLFDQQVLPGSVADALAEAKARNIADQHPNARVLGCDQVAEIGGEILSKPETPADAVAQIRQLSGRAHQLLSAAVLIEYGQVVWRHVGQVQLQMKDISADYLTDYVARNWHSIRHSVGAYKLEEEGVRLFSRIDGDYFNVLGLPLVELLSYLTERGELEI